jgi:hypothetical protein
MIFIGGKMKTVKLNFKYTKSEYIKAARQYLIAGKIISKFSIVFIVIFTLFSIYIGITTSFETLSIISLVVCFISILIKCTLYIYVPIKVFNHTSKFQEEYHLDFSQDCIKFTTMTIDSVLKWNTYSEVWENKDFYFMIQTSNAYTVIPKRAFEGNDAIQDFEQIVLFNFKKIKHL